MNIIASREEVYKRVLKRIIEWYKRELKEFQEIDPADRAW